MVRANNALGPDFYRLIQDRLHPHGMSVAEFASWTGLPRSAFHRWANGAEPSLFNYLLVHRDLDWLDKQKEKSND